MAKPLNNFEFATDTNYATGPDIGTPTKVAPSAGEIDSGFVRGTAAVAQHMNYLFGEIQDWLFYLAGLAADSEFLGDIKAWIEAEEFTWAAHQTFVNSVEVQGLFQGNGATFAGTVTVGADLNVGDDLVVTDNLTVGAGGINTSGSVSVTGSVTATDFVRNSRTIRESIPLSRFQPLLNTGHASIATLPPLPQSWVGPGQGGYGFHFYESASNYGGDRGGTAASLTSGNLIAACLEFVIPRGATLTGVRVGYRQADVSGGHDMYMTVSSLQENTVSTYDFTELGTRLVNDPGTDAAWALTVSVPTDAGFTPGSGHRFILRCQASAGSDSFEADLIHYVEVSYTTTNVNPND